MSLIKRLNTLYYTFFVLYIAAIGLFGYALKGKWLIDPMSTGGQIIQYVVIIYLLASVPGALYGFKQLMKRVSKITDPAQQERIYGRYAALRMTLIALGALLAIPAFYVLGCYQSMLWCAAIAIVAQYFCKPTERKVYLEMNDLSEDAPEPEQ